MHCYAFLHLLRFFVSTIFPEGSVRVLVQAVADKMIDMNKLLINTI